MPWWLILKWKDSGMKKPAWRSLVISIGFGVLLTAGCGGGGSGGSDNNNSPPIASAGADRNVDEETTTTLDGSQSSDSDGTIEKYAWSQIGGPAVTLNNFNTVTASYLAPSVTNQVSLTFRLSVTDDKGAQASDEVVHARGWRILCERYPL